MDQEVIRGDVIQIQFSLPDEGGNIEVQSAAVMWSGTLGEEEPRGAGVKFLAISPESNKRIRIFVDLLRVKEDVQKEWRSA